MSQPAQSTPPRQNFLQTFLLASVMFLAFQMFFNKTPEAPDTRSYQDLYRKMEQLSLEQKDASIAQEFNTYKAKVNAEKSFTQTQKDEQILKGTMLVASTQRKAGIERKDADRVNQAYTTIYNLQRVHNDEAIWRNKTYPVLNEAGNGFILLAPQVFYEQITQQLQLSNKDLKIWGFFPGYDFMDALVKATGAHSWSYGLAALLLAVIVRAVVWPFALKTMMHAKRMAQLAPLIKEIKDQYQGQDANLKVMELYKQYGMNPVSGCLPAVAQLPLFLIIFQAMNAYKFEFKHGTFLWINPSSSEATNGFLAPSLGELDYILIVIYGASMLLTSFLNPPSDPANAQQQKTTSMMVSVFFTITMFFWPLPSAFVLYWICANLLGALQTLWVNRLPVQPLMKRVGNTGVNTPLQNLMNQSFFGKTGSPRPKKHRHKK